MRIKSLALIPLLLMMAACAAGEPSKLTDPERDPYEETNRAIFAFNVAVDKAVLRPITIGYKAVLPKPARDGVSNVVRNLREPWVFVNDLLQGKPGRAFTTLGRFVINTTLGIGGLFKVSDDMGIQYHREDFGQTLATWGVGEGKYLVLPFFGPSTQRDLGGLTVDFVADPTDLALDAADVEGLQLTRIGLDALDTRVQLHDVLEELYKEKDPYIIARSAYLQQRAYEIRDGAKEEVDEDDLFGDFDEEDEPVEGNIPPKAPQ